MTQEGATAAKDTRIMAVKVVAVIAIITAVILGAATTIDYFVKDPFQDEAIADVASPDEAFYVLLIGSDSRKGTALYTGKASEHANLDQHADIITLMRIDPVNYMITLVTVPRDTMLDGTDYKINDNLLKGDPQKVVDATEALTGVDIRYYLMIDFTSYAKFVDSIGGTRVDVPLAVTVSDPMTAKDVKVNAGTNRLLNGSQSLVLARARKEYKEDQDALRQVNVRNLEKAIISSALTDRVALNNAWQALEKSITTNMDYTTMGSLAVHFLTNKEYLIVYSCTGPYDGDENKDKLWVVEEDKEAWGRLMEIVDTGQDPEGIIPLPEFPTS